MSEPIVNPGDIVAGRFVVSGTIGEGGMGTVFRAYDCETGEPVALKVLCTNAKVRDADRRFLHEGWLLESLDHPHIVRFRDLGRLAPGTWYLAMELVEGESLLDRIEDNGSLQVAEAVTFAGQILEALEAVHAEGIVHRDLKPQNVLLAGGMHAMLIDFGLAKVDDRQFTAAGFFVGSAAYASTEQLNGHPVDGRSDLFGVGALLYAMLTGRPPYTGKTAKRVRYQHNIERPVPPSHFRGDVPPALDDLVMALLDRDPGRRPRTAAVARAWLRSVDARADELAA